MTAILENIFISPLKVQPLAAVRQAYVARRAGIFGDRYAAHAGSFSKATEDADAGRDVTLIESEAIEAVLREHGIDLSTGQHRRNLITCGLAMTALPTNAYLRVGDQVVLRVDRTCPPCGHLERLVPGSLSALKGRGGLRTTVIAEGTIRTGDAIVVCTRREAEAFTEATSHV